MTKPKLAHRWISALLKYGSYVSLLTLSLGIMLLVLGASAPPVSSEIKALPSRQLLSGLFRLKAMALINLGLLVLMVTPILRVIVAIFSFILEKDLKYSLIASLVLLVLMFSLLLAAL